MALGGILAKPASKFEAFQNSSTFISYPYLFPCLLSGIISFLCFITTLLILPETWTKKESKIQSDEEYITLLGNASSPRPKKKKRPNFWNTQVILVILENLLMWIGFIMYDEVFPLWAKNPSSEGGIDFSSLDIGIFFAISGVQIVAVQLLLIPYLTNRFSSISLIRVGIVICIPTFVVIPWFTETVPHGKWLVWFVLLVGMMGVVLGCNILSIPLSVVGNNVVDSSNLGKMNGFMQGGIAIGRVLGPTVGSTLFAWSCSNGYNFPFDYHFIYLLFGLLFSVMLIIAFFLSARPDKKRKNSLIN